MTTEDPQSFIQILAKKIYDKKGFNILALDVRGVCFLTDYFLIAEGNVERHVTALSNEVVKTAEEAGYEPLYVEGMKGGGWVVVDLGQIIVHLFAPELRDKYALEQLWNEGEIIDLELTER